MPDDTQSDADDTDLDELRERTQKGSRVQAAAAAQPDRHDLLVDEYRAVLSGETSKTIAVRDDVMAGLLQATMADDDLHADLADALQSELGESADQAGDRSALVRQLLRVGLREAAPDLEAQATDAYGEAVTDDQL